MRTQNQQNPRGQNGTPITPMCATAVYTERNQWKADEISKFTLVYNFQFIWNS